MLFKETSLDCSNVRHGTSVEALRKLVRLEALIVKISPQSYKLSNGVELCSVVLKGADGIDYSIQAYGKEALELHKEASMLMQPPIMTVPHSLT